MGRQKFLDQSSLLHIRSHLFLCGICHLIIHLVHLLFQIKQKCKSGSQSFPHSHSLFQFGMLIQVSYTDIFCPLNLPFIRLQFSGDNAHEGRFTLAVGAHQTDVLTL